MKKYLLLLSILLLTLTGCSDTVIFDIDEISYATAVQIEASNNCTLSNSAADNDCIFPDNAANYPYTPQESIEAVLSSLLISLNSEPHTLVGLEIDEQVYFRLEEILPMLYGTRASFDFFSHHDTPTNIDISWRWNFDSRREFWGMKKSDEPPAIESGTATPAYITLRINMMRDFWFSHVSAFEVNGDIFFNLNDLSYIFGYIHFTENGAVHIDTMQPNISEYGFTAATDFLSKRPTLFTTDWTDEIREATPSLRYYWWPEGLYNFPYSYHLFDFNNDGIPEILMRYEMFADDPMWGIHILYVYENGEFMRAGRFSYWGDLFTDSQGNFYSLEGSHQEGFARIVHFAFTEDGILWEVFAERGVQIEQLPESERIPFLKQAEVIWDEVSFSPPSFKGVPLRVIRPFKLPELFYAAALNSIVPFCGHECMNEYIIQAIEDFLYPLLTIFDFGHRRDSGALITLENFEWYNRYGERIDEPEFVLSQSVPIMFALYDFGDGLPVILLYYAGLGFGGPPSAKVYRFVDGEFSFAIGLGRMPIFFHDSTGRVIVHYNMEYGGHFGYYFLTFYADVTEKELIIAPSWPFMEEWWEHHRAPYWDQNPSIFQMADANLTPILRLTELESLINTNIRHRHGLE